MCAQTPEDYTYAAYGGVVPRADMMHGRVGSAFSPAEGAPAHHGEAYEGPVFISPEYAEGGNQTQSHATTAFDPGDVLTDEPH